MRVPSTKSSTTRIAAKLGQLLAMLAVIAFLAATGLMAVAQHPCDGDVCPPARHVYLIRGAGSLSYWPRGDVFIERLNAAGFQVSDYNSNEVLRMTEKIRCRHASGQQIGPLVFLGYSSGGDCACRVARQLQRDGIGVDHLILIESTLGVSVPSNVSYCLNLYKSDPALDWIPALRGVPLERDSAGTQLRNIDARYHPDWQWVAHTHHLTMLFSDRIQCTLVGYVEQIHARH